MKVIRIRPTGTLVEAFESFDNLCEALDHVRVSHCQKQVDLVVPNKDEGFDTEHIDINWEKAIQIISDLSPWKKPQHQLLVRPTDVTVIKKTG